MYKKIGHTLQSDSDNTNGLCKIDTPAGHQDPFPQGPDPKTLAGAWASITNPEEIVRHICAANLHQYNQANNTPFATEPLKSYIGTNEQSDRADMVLSREVPLPLLDSLQCETKQLLASLKSTSAPMATNVDITVEDFISCYMIVKEQMSSSPSGRHVSHYKAAIYHSHLEPTYIP
jgi:hypothetical protein